MKLWLLGHDGDFISFPNPFDHLDHFVDLGFSGPVTGPIRHRDADFEIVFLRDSFDFAQSDYFDGVFPRNRVIGTNLNGIEVQAVFARREQEQEREEASGQRETRKGYLHSRHSWRREYVASRKEPCLVSPRTS